MEINHSFPMRGRATLAEYRLYFLDSIQTGRLISEAMEFEAGSDGAAFEVAESMREGRPVELWRGARKLKIWPASDRRANSI